MVSRLIALFWCCSEKETHKYTIIFPTLLIPYWKDILPIALAFGFFFAGAGLFFISKFFNFNNNIFFHFIFWLTQSLYHHGIDRRASLLSWWWNWKKTTAKFSKQRRKKFDEFDSLLISIVCAVHSVSLVERMHLFIFNLWNRFCSVCLCFFNVLPKID